MNNFGEKVNVIWSVADLLRDTFKRSKYQDVILPLTVLRRIDCVLQPTETTITTLFQPELAPINIFVTQIIEPLRLLIFLDCETVKIDALISKINEGY